MKTNLLQLKPEMFKDISLVEMIKMIKEGITAGDNPGVDQALKTLTKEESNIELQSMTLCDGFLDMEMIQKSLNEIKLINWEGFIPTFIGVPESGEPASINLEEYKTLTMILDELHILFNTNDITTVLDNLKFDNSSAEEYLKENNKYIIGTKLLDFSQIESVGEVLERIPGWESQENDSFYKKLIKSIMRRIYFDKSYYQERSFYKVKTKDNLRLERFRYVNEIFGSLKLNPYILTYYILSKFILPISFNSLDVLYEINICKDLKTLEEIRVYDHNKVLANYELAMTNNIISGDQLVLPN